MLKQGCAWLLTNMNGRSLNKPITSLVHFSTAPRAISGRWPPCATLDLPAECHQIAQKLRLEGADGNPAFLLLVLLMFINDTVITTSVVEQATMPKNRWNPDGEHISITPVEAGVNQILADLVLKPESMARSLELLITTSLLQRDKSVADSLHKYVLPADIRRTIEELDKARSVLGTWKPLNPQSPFTVERHVWGLVHSKLGMVLRFQGCFVDALTCLQQAVCSQSGLISRWETICELADVLTELDRPDEAMITIAKEQEVCTGDARLNPAGQRRLQLSLAEAFMRKELYEDAASIYRAANNGGSFAKLRTAIGLARVAHSQRKWDEAFDQWNHALKLLSNDFPRGDTHSGHTYLAILESTHHVLLMRGERDYAAQTQENIKEIRKTSDIRGCTNWIPGLNTYWLQSLHGDTLRARL
ncbi:hypothetical protein EJ03DRAFT_27253 [Teratosphaeria nubilosa]|uniref:MalT-like TPR region domain-containing protein n=1 Tax=Teratosphaeria nubilosa TaxID=161662 RepID=A0A6G1KVN1_9PEZI|nr:hypothetical protein EJ03DRAFT_27253 [Teratosphaeria nubilosa]